MDAKKLGWNIKMIRELNGLSRSQLAALIGMSDNGLGKIERGETRISLQRLEQIADALKVTVHDLMAFDPHKWGAV